MLIIRGLEVTQAVQYYGSDQHLTDPGEQLPDNSVRLIANKPAWVRVYVESDSEQSIANVTGTITLKWGFLSIKTREPPLMLNPQPPGSVTAQFNPDYKTSRAAIAATLNFIIPLSPFIVGLTITSNAEPKISALDLSKGPGDSPWRSYRLLAARPHHSHAAPSPR